MGSLPKPFGRLTSLLDVHVAVDVGSDGVEECLSNSCTTFMCSPAAMSAEPVLCLSVCKPTSEYAPRSRRATSARSEVDLTALWMKSDTGDDVNVRMA